MLQGRTWGTSVALGVLVLGLISAVPHPDARTVRAGDMAAAPAPAHGPTSTTLLDWARRGPAPAGEAVGETVITPPPATFDAAPGPTTPPPAALRTGFEDVTPGPGVWAVVVGINDYPGRGSDLRSAAADARDVDEALARYGVPDSQRLLLLDRQASANTIRRSFDWLVAHAGHDATAVVFYAGHVRKDSGREVIVAADGGLIADQEMADRLAGLRARRTWIGMAACYGGGFTEVLAPGRILTAAAGANSLAYETTAYGRSYMVEYMVRRAMIHGAAPDSIESAFHWAAQALRRDHPGRVPVQFDRVEGDLRLGAAIVTAPPPPPPPPPTQQEPPPSEPDSDAPGGSGGPSGGSWGGDDPPDDDGDGCAGVQVGNLLDCG